MQEINEQDNVGEGHSLQDCDELNIGDMIGKEFETYEEAYTFYNQYVYMNGFGVRIHNSHKKRLTNAIYRRQYVCNKQEFKVLNDKRHKGKEPKRKTETRTGCEAMIQITISANGKWVVDKFHDTH